MQATQAQRAQTLENPYAGPRPFEENDKCPFFGRVQEVADLYSLVAAHRSILVYAQSGVGKTSLIQAGLLPALRRSSFKVLPIARVSGIETSNAGENVYVRNALKALGASGANTLQEHLGTAAHRRALIFDQFEELFTTTPERWKDRVRFFEDLASAMEADPLLRLLLVLREDWLASMEQYEDLLPAEMGPRFRLEALTRTAALRAIKGPLEGSPVQYGDNVAEELADDLLKTKLNTPGQFVDPVQLQVVCFRLFEQLPAGTKRITKEALKDLGDVDAALRNYYEAALKEAIRVPGATENRLREWFDAELITEHGTRGISQAAPARIPHKAIELLSANHLIRPELRGSDTWYELSHDRFIRPVRKANERWRKKRERNTWLWRAALIAIVAAGAAFLLQTFEQQYALKRQRVAATSQLLALQALRLADSREDDEKMLLFARQAQIFHARYPQQEVYFVDEALYTATHAHALSTILRGHQKTVRAVAFAQNGGRLITASEDGEIRLWDLQHAGSAPLKLNPGGGAVYALAVSGPSQRLAAGSQDAVVRVWDLNNLSAPPLLLRGHQSQTAVYSVAFSSGGDKLVSGGGDGAVLIWDLTAPTSPITLLRQGAAVDAVAFSRDDRSIVSGSSDSSVNITDVRSRKSRQIEFGNTDVKTVALSPDGSKVASAGLDQNVRVWDLNNAHAPPIVLKGHSGAVYSVSFSPSGRWLASAGGDRTIRIWSMEQFNAPPIVLKGHGDWVLGVAFSPDGKVLASAGADHTVRLWKLAPSRPPAITLSGIASYPNSWALSADLQKVAIGMQNQKVGIWDLSAPSAPRLLEGPQGYLYAVAFSPDGKRVAAGSNDHTLSVWDLTAAVDAARVVLPHESPVNAVAFAEEEPRLATATVGGTIRVWDLKSRQAVVSLKVKNAGLVAFSPNGRYLAAGSAPVELWDLQKLGAGPRQLAADSGNIRSILFSPGGKQLALGNQTGDVHVLDVTGNGSFVLHGPVAPVYSLAFSPDGKKLLSGRGDSTVLLWDLRQPGAAPLLIQEVNWPVFAVRFSKDGSRAMAVGGEGKAVSWSLGSALADDICKSVTRNITDDEWRVHIGYLPWEPTCPGLPRLKTLDGSN